MTSNNLHTIVCTFCDYSAPTIDMLKIHINSTHIKNAVHTENREFGPTILYPTVDLKISNLYMCSLCHFQCCDTNDLTIHVKNKHPEEFFCYRECDYQSLTHHELTQHHQDNHWTLKCDKCEFSTDKKNKLKWHVDYAHENMRYPCIYCSYEGGRKDYLRKHYKVVHPLVKPVYSH